MKKRITRCSYCKKYQTESGEWVEKKPVGAKKGINGNMTAGICPKCYKKVMGEFDND